MNDPHATELLQLFETTGALLNGHFVLRSGLHSRQFFQCAHLLQYPQIASKVCGWLAERLTHIEVTTVISPAMGGLFVGHELARHLGKRHLFVEKEEGHLVLRRNFAIHAGERCVIAEDVITRGGRALETVEIVRAHGGLPVVVASLVDRSGGEHADFGCPLISLLSLSVETFPADALPPDLAAIPATHPGSA